MKMSLIPTEHVSKIWDKVSGFLEKATELNTPRRYDAVDLFEACLLGKQTLWVIFDEDSDNEVVGALTTTVRAYPRYSALSVPYMGGVGVLRYRDLVIETLSRFARDSGLSVIEGYGREGWARIGKKFGVKKAYTVYEIDLAEEAKIAAE